MTEQLSLFPLLGAPASAGALGPEQIDGHACLLCGRLDLPMAPVGYLAGGQVFVCDDDLPAVSGAKQSAVRSGISADVRWTEDVS
ncbi:hypothetical protein [Embleya sp. NBC_00896]|uniref:hypothetical protein n=1 Tax=Embleya sp. NBC_00896 TaxID=2975961 RepID=UPI00386C74DB|nr:hypothetical protein OG928_17590 [Embleya sp. NBC_00896]